MAEVLVEHDYTAKEPNELSITKGDIIKEVVKKQSGWLEGTLRDKKGLFPDNYVKFLEKDPTVVLRNKKDAARIRQCRVVFSYKQDHEDELNLNVGDIIDILGEEEEGWWRGILNGKQGVFPSNFVEEIPPTVIKSKYHSKENLFDSSDDGDSPTLPAKPNKILCEVNFPYKAQNGDELTLKEGDIVTLISKDGQDPGWWKGELNGVVGLFPDNFVTVIPSNDDKQVKRLGSKSLVGGYIKPSAVVSSQRRSLESQINDNKQETNEVGTVIPSTDDKQVKEVVRTITTKSHAADSYIKTNTVVSSQRRSLETQLNDNKQEINEITAAKNNPPVPGKKPLIPIKKSPSGSSSTGGIFQGLKKKLVDVVDGATGSKSVSPPKMESSSNENISENAFDDVQRRPLLSDVRASRPKAPGRRLPSGVYKDIEVGGIVNGNADHVTTTTDSSPLPSVSPSNLSSSPVDTVDNKPKLREWEKHRAPWLEEMKLNQAKRTSTSPGPETRLKLTPTEKNTIDTSLDDLTEKPSKIPFEKESSPISHKLKTPPNELDRTAQIRNKVNVPTPTRPQTIHNITTSSNINDSHLAKPPTPQHPKVSPLTTKTPSPLQKTIVNEHKITSASSNDNTDGPIQKQQLELLDRINKLEDIVKKQQLDIEELRGKLQIETEMRMELQARFETYMGENSDIQQI